MDTTFIWEKSIIHECPYLLIKEIELNFTDSFAISTNLFFQIQNKILDCEMTIYTTTENIFFTNSSKSYNLPKSSINLNIEQNIILADMDKRSFNILSILEKMIKSIQQQHCFMNINILNNIEKNFNEYTIFKDSKGKELVLYNNNGEILIASCIKN